MSTFNASRLISDLDLSHVDGVNSALSRTEGDEQLYQMIRHLRTMNLATRRLVEESFSCLCYFYTDCDHEKLRDYACRLVDKLEGKIELKKLLEETGGAIEGVELSNSSGTQFAIFLPDASEPGRFRYSCFDNRGFFNHATFDSYSDALSGAWSAGFRTRVFNQLESLCTLSEWYRGSKHTALIQQHNLDKITYGEFLKALEAA